MAKRAVVAGAVVLAFGAAMLVFGFSSLRAERASGGWGPQSIPSPKAQAWTDAGHQSDPGSRGGARRAVLVPTPSPRSLPRVGSQDPTIQRLIGAGQPIYCGAATRPLVALTFDDGPGPYTLQTIGALRHAGMTATFFEVGKLLGETEFAGIPRAAARFGAVGDHTWDHVSVVGLGHSGLQAEIGRTRRALEYLTGGPIFLFRPPYGARDPAVDAYVRSKGMLEVLWSIDSRDSDGARADQIAQTVAEHLAPGAIVLLHENRGTTQNALPRIIHLILEHGYRTVTVPQLLRMDPPTPTQLRNHTCT